LIELATVFDVFHFMDKLKAGRKQKLSNFLRDVLETNRANMSMAEQLALADKITKQQDKERKDTNKNRQEKRRLEDRRKALPNGGKINPGLVKALQEQRQKGDS
jgi:hypothetical protein